MYVYICICVYLSLSLYIYIYMCINMHVRSAGAFRMCEDLPRPGQSPAGHYAETGPSQ